MEENPNLSQAPQEQVASKKSLFSQMFPNFSRFQFNFKAVTYLIPVGIVILVLLIGGGGTYIVASNVFKGNVDGQRTGSRVSESDIPSFDAISLPTPTPTEAVPQITPVSTQLFLEELSSPTAPSVVIDPAANWITYTFPGGGGLTFKYPPGWYVNVPATSGPPYLYVQNFPASQVVSGNAQGMYAIKIARFDQVGIATIDQLVTQLATNDVNNVNINGINLGIPTIISSETKTVNGYPAYERTLTYSNSPFSQVKELYILNGVSTAVVITQLYDKDYGRTYYDSFLTTISY